jgi:hypothetical protein
MIIHLFMEVVEEPQILQLELGPNLAQFLAYLFQFLLFHFLGIGMVLCCHFPLYFTRR